MDDLRLWRSYPHGGAWELISWGDRARETHVVGVRAEVTAGCR